MKAATRIKSPKDVSEECGVFDVTSFGHTYKSLCDLSSEATIEQRAEKLREDASALAKKGHAEKGQPPTYFKNWSPLFASAEASSLSLSALCSIVASDVK